jgi:membrane fusion protein, multidrug efflux system
MRWVLTMIVALAAVGSGAWWAIGADVPKSENDSAELDEAGPGADPSGPPERHVDTAAVEGMLGVIVPAHEVQLAPAYATRVAEVDVVVGQPVDAGQRLARMDTRADESELAAARAASAAARAEARRVQIEADRAHNALLRARGLQGIVPDAELDDLASDHAASMAQGRGAGATASERSARARQISARIEDAEIRAPFAGVIARRLIEPGATVAAGEPVVHLVSRTLLVRFAVPEDRTGDLQLGKPVTVEIPELSLQLTGVISSVALEVETTARIVMAEAELREIDAHDVRIGTLGRVAFGPPASIPLEARK